MRVEVNVLGVEAGQYAGRGHPAAGIGLIAENARRFEALGFGALMMPEAGHDPFLPLMVAAEHTQRVYLGTNVAIAFPRSPMVTAQMSWDLQRFSGGRFLLGLGTQVKGHNERRYSTPWPSPPGPRLREYVLCLQAIFRTFQNGNTPQHFTGRHYQFTLISPFFNPGPNPSPHVPIYLAAVNPYNCRLAGELCEGVRLHPLTGERYTRDVVLSAIAEGARKAGRTRKDIDVVGMPFIATGANAEEVRQAVQDVKQRISFYASTRTYHPVLEHNGWGEIGRTLHQMSLEGKWNEMPRLVSDEIVHEFAAVGTYDEIGAQLRERWGSLFDAIHLDLPSRVLADDAIVRKVIAPLQG